LIAIVGPNGAGKSTLHQSRATTHSASICDVVFLVRPYREQASRIGYVLSNQRRLDFPIDALGLSPWACIERSVVRRVTKKYDCRPGRVERVGLAEFASRQISQLSGGSSNEFSWREPWSGTPTCI